MVKGTLRYVQFFAEFLNGFAFFIAPDRFDFELSWVFQHSLEAVLEIAEKRREIAA